MASTFTTLGLELMATGENAGTWGDKTNTNLSMVQAAVASYVEKSIAGGAATTTLTITDGDATESTSVARSAIIKLTGTISGNQIVTVPDSLEKTFIVVNGTSGSHTVQFKTASGSGVTFAATDKSSKFLFADGTNINEIISQSIPADTVALGDAASSFATSSGAVLIDSQASTTTVDGHTGVTIQSTSSGNITLDSVADIVLDAAGNDWSFKAGGTEVLKITNSSSDVIIKPIVDAKDIIFQQRDGTEVARIEDNATFNVSSAGKFAYAGVAVTSTAAELNLVDGITAGTVSASLAVIADSNKDITGFRNLTTTGNAIVGGDLTISGDDLTMATNTAGHLLIADGTNFNPVAVTSLTAISTIAADDTFLAVDTSGGGLKKVARSVVVAGLATSSALTEIVQDTSPQLGGNLDTNSQNILIDDAHFLGDESGNEQIIFQTTGSAVNQFDVTNAASGSGPQLSATGSDSNIDLNILPKGTGHVTVVGNTNSGTIQFNCESNSHGQIIRAQPHSASATNIMLLPEGADSTLVSLVSTDTLTNKTLTSPKINENVAVTSTATELNFNDGVTLGTAIASKTVTTDSNKDTTGFRNITLSGELDAATGDFSGVVDVAGATTTAAITASGIIKTDDGTDATSTTDGSLQTDGGLSVAKDTIIGNDLKLLSDSAVLVFGAGSDATLTHTNDVGLTLNSTNKLMFNDASQFIQGASATVLDIAATDEIELTATLIDVVGALTISGITSFPDGSAGAPSITNTGDVNTGLLFSAADTMSFTAGGTAQFTMADGLIAPVTDNDVDLGTNSLQFKNVHVNGTTFTDALGFGTVVMTLPTADGDANQILTTDGSGTLAFVDNSGGTDWQAVKTGNFTAAAGQGVFANTTSAAFTVTLPAGSIGDEISIIDYAGTFDSNALTVAANGSEKINASTDDLTISVERAALTLVFTDGTQGWLVRG